MPSDSEIVFSDPTYIIIVDIPSSFDFRTKREECVGIVSNQLDCDPVGHLQVQLLLKKDIVLKRRDLLIKDSLLKIQFLVIKLIKDGSLCFM